MSKEDDLPPGVVRVWTVYQTDMNGSPSRNQKQRVYSSPCVKVGPFEVQVEELAVQIDGKFYRIDLQVLDVDQAAEIALAQRRMAAIAKLDKSELEALGLDELGNYNHKNQ